MRSDDKKVYSVDAEAKDGTNSSMLEDAAFIFSLQVCVSSCGCLYGSKTCRNTHGHS